MSARPLSLISSLSGEGGMKSVGGGGSAARKTLPKKGRRQLSDATLFLHCWHFGFMCPRTRQTGFGVCTYVHS